MSNAITARELGDEYQKLVFWLYVNKMLTKKNDIEKVGYEYDEIKSMDDVVVFYSKPQIDGDLRNIIKDYIQVKFHMRQSNFFTFDNLLDPEFVNSTRYSALDKVVMAYKKLGDEFKNRRFIFYSQWEICQTDELYNLVSNVNQSIDVHRLYIGGPKSKMGILRKKLCDKLSILEGDLKIVLSQIRLYTHMESFNQLLDNLNTEFIHNGLKCCPKSRINNPYNSLISNWMHSNINEFDADFILKECEQQNLIEKHKTKNKIGICSFPRDSGYLSQTAQSMINLVPLFNGRFLKDEYTWEGVYELINEYVMQNLNQEDEYQLYLEAHLSISFIAGRILNPKSGRKVVPLQKSIEGREIWKNQKGNTKQSDCLNIESIDINEYSSDTAIVIGLSNYILDDVRDFIKEENLNISVIYNASLSCAGPAAVADAGHAWGIVEQLNKCIEQRERKLKRGILHVFAASPAAIMFNLGKMSLSYGKIILYEFDFLRIKHGTYYKTITFPVGGEN
nr:SAVED domain-containing protein [uncultured Clostridium sp.]